MTSNVELDILSKNDECNSTDYDLYVPEFFVKDFEKLNTNMKFTGKKYCSEWNVPTVELSKNIDNKSIEIGRENREVTLSYNFYNFVHTLCKQEVIPYPVGSFSLSQVRNFCIHSLRDSWADKNHLILTNSCHHDNRIPVH